MVWNTKEGDIFPVSSDAIELLQEEQLIKENMLENEDNSENKIPNKINELNADQLVDENQITENKKVGTIIEDQMNGRKEENEMTESNNAVATEADADNGENLDVSPHTPPTVSSRLENELVVDATRDMLPLYNRPVLRNGSPFNGSFTVKSEPSSPCSSAFPRLRKAEALSSLVENPLKRVREESPSTTVKRPCRGLRDWIPVPDFCSLM